jgi:hypothetical protein
MADHWLILCCHLLVNVPLAPQVSQERLQMPLRPVGTDSLLCCLGPLNPSSHLLSVWPWSPDLQHPHLQMRLNNYKIAVRIKWGGVCKTISHKAGKLLKLEKCWCLCEFPVIAWASGKGWQVSLGAQVTAKCYSANKRMTACGGKRPLAERFWR